MLRLLYELNRLAVIYNNALYIYIYIYIIKGYYIY